MLLGVQPEWGLEEKQYSPKRPSPLFKILLDPVSRPPMENPALIARGLPVQTVPKVARTRARSTPIPYTTHVSTTDSPSNKVEKRTFVSRGNGFGELAKSAWNSIGLKLLAYCSHTTTRDIAMVCQRIESRTRASLVAAVKVGWVEGMLPSKIGRAHV